MSKRLQKNIQLPNRVHTRCTRRKMENSHPLLSEAAALAIFGSPQARTRA